MTPEDKQAVQELQQIALKICAAVATADALGVPSGHVYAQVMDHTVEGHPLSATAFNGILSILERGGFITRDGFTLKPTQYLLDQVA